MHLDLVDHLRCPRPHAAVPGGVALVCVPTRLSGRVLGEAMLGCPICHARFAVADGVAWFGDGEAPGSTSQHVSADGAAAPDDTEVLRLAAMLNLDGPGGWVLLHGDFVACAGALVDAFGVATIRLMGRVAPSAVAHGSVLAGVTDVLPLAPALLRGAAFGPGTSVPLLASAATALMPNGRLVAPVACDPPSVLGVLARDDRHWVAEPRAAPVSLRRSQPPPRTPGR